LALSAVLRTVKQDGNTLQKQNYKRTKDCISDIQGYCLCSM